MTTGAGRPRVGLADGRETGATLAELLVYMLVLAIIMGITGTLLIRSLQTQRDVRAVTEATNTAQLVAQSVQRGVRNAAAIGYASGVEGETLMVRTRVSTAATSSWQCQAWHVHASSGAVYTRMLPASGSGPVLSPPASAMDLGAWTLLAEGSDPGTTGVPVFSVSGQSVTIDLAVAAGPKKPVVVRTQVTARQQGETGGAPCF